MKFKTEKNRKRISIYNKTMCNELHDEYVKSLLRTQKVLSENITPELIEMKRLDLKINRNYKEIRKWQSEL